MSDKGSNRKDHEEHKENQFIFACFALLAVRLPQSTKHKTGGDFVQALSTALGTSTK